MFGLGRTAFILLVGAFCVIGFRSFHRYFRWTSIFDTETETKVSTDRYFHSEEVRAKISAANRGKAPWNVGKKHDEETKRKIAERTRAAMLQKKLEKAQELGLTLEEYDARKVVVKKEKRKMQLKGGLTEEGRKRISESARKRWQDPERRATYLAKLAGGRNHSEETRARISAAIRKKWQEGVYGSKPNISLSDEQRARISQKMKSLWEDPAFRERMLRNRGDRGDDWRAKISTSIKALWENETYRSSVLSGLRASNHTINRVSASRISDDERQRRREEARASRASKRKAKRKAMSKAKNAQIGTIDQQSFKEILGQELWIEEKVCVNLFYVLK